MRQIIVSTIGILLVCITILVTLYANSPISNGMYRASFVRKSIKEATQLAVIDVAVNSYYVAGATNTTLYFGNQTAPFHILSTNYSLLDSQHINLKISLDSIIAFKRFKLSVDSPYFYLAHGTMPEYLRGSIGHWVASRYLGDYSEFSVESMPIDSTTLVLRYYNKTSKSYELGIITPNKPLNTNFDLLQKQIDGLFCLDGRILYDKQNSKVVYMHYYKNEIVIADRNLTVLNRRHTIDTFSRVQMKVKEIEMAKESTISGTPIKININADVFNNKLFVQSNLMSAHENEKQFKANSTFDVYDLTTGNYISSFYISNSNGKIESFKIFKEKLIATCGHFLTIYELPTEITKL